MSNNENDSIQAKIFKMIKEQTGENNLLAIPKAFIDLAGGLRHAAFLSQLLYWSDKGLRKDGFIWKSDKEFAEEIGVSKYQIRKSREKFLNEGIIETKKKKANGYPTIHYKLLIKPLISSFYRNHKKEIAKSKEGNCEIERTLTDITAERLTENTKECKRVGNQKPAPNSAPSFPFEHPKIQNLLNNNYSVFIKENVEYYLHSYEKHIGEKHPNLKLEQWQKVFDNIASTVDGKYDKYYELYEERFQAVVDQHFKSNYEDCDYNILHFISGDIMLNRMYEVAY